MSGWQRTRYLPELVVLWVADTDDDLTVPIEATADWEYLRLCKETCSDNDLKKWVPKSLASRAAIPKCIAKAKGPGMAHAGRAR